MIYFYDVNTIITDYGTRLKNGTDIAISDFFNYMWSSEYESRLI